MGQKVTHLFKTVNSPAKKVSHKVEHFSKKVSQKVASFFKKGDESDTPVDSVFLVGAA